MTSPLCPRCGAALPPAVVAGGGGCGFCGAPIQGDPRAAQQQLALQQQEPRERFPNGRR